MRKLFIPVVALGLAAVVLAFGPAPEATPNVSDLNGA